MRSYSGLLALGLFWVGVLASPCDAADPRDIGKAVEIHNEVTATQASDGKRHLAKQSPVREHELIEAAFDARGEFVLSDNTKLVLGPGARLLLDEFVYDPNQRTASKVVIGSDLEYEAIKIDLVLQALAGARMDCSYSKLAATIPSGATGGLSS